MIEKWILFQDELQEHGGSYRVDLRLVKVTMPGGGIGRSLQTMLDRAIDSGEGK